MAVLRDRSDVLITGDISARARDREFILCHFRRSDVEYLCRRSFEYVRGHDGKSVCGHDGKCGCDHDGKCGCDHDGKCGCNRK